MKYETPEIKFVEFEANEVIVASTTIPTNPPVIPEDKEDFGDL